MGLYADTDLSDHVCVQKPKRHAREDHGVETQEPVSANAGHDVIGMKAEATDVVHDNGVQHDASTSVRERDNSVSGQQQISDDVTADVDDGNDDDIEQKDEVGGNDQEDQIDGEEEGEEGDDRQPGNAEAALQPRAEEAPPSIDAVAQEQIQPTTLPIAVVDTTPRGAQIAQPPSSLSYASARSQSSAAAPLDAEEEYLLRLKQVISASRVGSRAESQAPSRRISRQPSQERGDADTNTSRTSVPEHAREDEQQQHEKENDQDMQKEDKEKDKTKEVSAHSQADARNLAVPVRRHVPADGDTMIGASWASVESISSLDAGPQPRVESSTPALPSIAPPRMPQALDASYNRG